MKTQVFKISLIALSLAFLSTFYVSHAEAQNKQQQEISFSSKSYKEVLAAAKASHKKVFVDAFATWCAPCKELRKRTFNDPKAARYFNKNFINFSIDVEKGEGPELAKTWRVEGLPTLLIVDENGKALAIHTGFVDGKGLIEFSQEASEDSGVKRTEAAQNR